MVPDVLVLAIPEPAAPTGLKLAPEPIELPPTDEVYQFNEPMVE